MIQLQNYIRDIQDFPKKGIVFKDLTPLLNNPKAMNFCLEELLKQIGNQKIDKVVGIESRGYFFATLLAQKLHAGFVPIRKPGKLPYTTISQKYALEYGTDSIEMHVDAIKKGEKILLHDDVLATGGTAQAACKLIETLGGEIVQCNFIMKLDFLNGKDKLSPYKITSLLDY